MSLFRSDRMGYYSIVMPRESSWEILNELGTLDCLQFVDLNIHETAFNRPYSNYVRRCEEMEVKITSVETEMKKFGKRIDRCDDSKMFLRNLKDFLDTRNKSEHTYFEEAENDLEERVASLNEQIKTYDNLVEKYNHLVEYREVLTKTRPYIGESGIKAQNAAEGLGNDEAGIDYVVSRDIKFNYLAGVIDKADSQRFKRIVFRVTRGMTWTTLLDIDREEDSAQEKKDSQDPTLLAKSQENFVSKTVFLIVYQGGNHDMMKGKLNKICDSFGASKYGIPEDATTFNKKLLDIDIQIRDAQSIVQITRNHIQSILEGFSAPRGNKAQYSYIEELRLFTLKEKLIYHNLNQLKLQNTIYHGNCWCPLESAKKVQEALRNLKQLKTHIAGCEFNEADYESEHLTPPTYLRLNDFTRPFQEIVNTYGVPRYREANPGLFAIATFPFLFGVMFGDIGHGGLLFTFGLYLVMYKSELEKNKKSLLYALLPARYLFLLQGMMAFYCGLIYNDFMAMPLNLFGSCYEEQHGSSSLVKEDNCNYPIGIDPSWYGTQNELAFLNSLKMKLSIVLGVTHMTFGIFLKGSNAIYFGNWIDFIFEFIPQLIFMTVTFGYMVVLIFIKWSMPWAEIGTAKSPSIINIFIGMALNPGKYDQSTVALYGDSEGNYQADLQLSFLIIAFICVPIILFPKPLILLCLNSRKSSNSSHKGESGVNQPLLNNEGEGARLVENEEGNERKPAAGGHGGHGHGEFEFGEIFVHQVIETIEFVLGCVSNTASYLRLWALSLAHSQLAKVFFDNTLGGAITNGSFFGAFIGFAIFAQVTLGVLLLMDQMECFLHALRLHWVEFQSKFYKADGYAFEPFSFQNTIAAAEKID